MQGLFNKNSFYLSLLLFFPAMAIVSWVNAYFRNYTYEMPEYLVLFVLPAWFLAYVVSLFFRKRFNSNFLTILLAFLISLEMLVLTIKVVIGILGYNTIFETSKFPLSPIYLEFDGHAFFNPCPDPHISITNFCELGTSHLYAANKVYPIEFIMSVFIIFVAYKLAKLTVHADKKLLQKKAKK